MASSSRLSGFALLAEDEISCAVAVLSSECGPVFRTIPREYDNKLEILTVEIPRQGGDVVLSTDDEEGEMDSLALMVNESLARHGVETGLDHRRLAWSRWFRCESSLSFVFVPGKPGIFALGEEVLAPEETSATDGKRMLAIFRIAQAEDLGMALGRYFLPGSPERERMESGRCFIRYAVIEDAAQRRSAHASLNHWLATSADSAFGFGD